MGLQWGRVSGGYAALILHKNIEGEEPHVH